MKCIDCKAECEPDFSSTMNYRGEGYYKATCPNCGKVHWCKCYPIKSIKIEIEVK